MRKLVKSKYLPFENECVKASTSGTNLAAARIIFRTSGKFSFRVNNEHVSDSKINNEIVQRIKAFELLYKSMNSLLDD